MISWFSKLKFKIEFDDETLIHIEFRNSQNKSDFVESFDTIITIVDVVDIWNFQEINYFDFFYNNKITVIDDSIKHVDKNIYIRDVYNFIKRIQNIIIIKNHQLMRDNLYTCFKNKALHWYIVIFISNVKRIIKYDENIDEWKRIFLKRWKQFIIFVVFIFKKNKIYNKKCSSKTWIYKICFKTHQNNKSYRNVDVFINHVDIHRFEIEI